MKYAYFNPTIVAMDDVPDDIFQWCVNTVEQAHHRSDLNDAGNPALSIRGGQQIQILPNEMGLDIDPLARYVEDICTQYIDTVRASAGITEELPVKPVLVSAWTLKQGPGDYQALHSHEAHLSGNIYIEVPELDIGHTNTDSCIEFRLPTVRNPARFTFTDTWRFRPERAKIIMFPSYLPHTVYPWRGNGHRISLAWDAKLVDKNL
jgi:hypothetical protein